ncbi:MAG: hypothetical protein ACI9FO_001427, partial [Methylophagaceae bacterium]
VNSAGAFLLQSKCNKILAIILKKENFTIQTTMQSESIKLKLHD